MKKAGIHSLEKMKVSSLRNTIINRDYGDRDYGDRDYCGRDYCGRGRYPRGWQPRLVKRRPPAVRKYQTSGTLANLIAVVYHCYGM